MAKELKKLDVQEERLVDLAADGTLATETLRKRLRDIQIKKHQVRSQLDTTDEHLRTRTETILSYLDLMERPDALFISASGAVKRQLLAPFFSTIWVDEDGHRATVTREFQPLVAEVRDAVHSPGNARSAGDVSDASSAERLNLYLKVICSSMTSFVAGAGLEPATSRL